MSINDGGPAFPQLHGTRNGEEGMTLRDYFAAAALTGLCQTFGVTFAAAMAYEHADAMLKARKAQP